MNKIVFDNGYMTLVDENLKDAFNRKIFVAVDFDNNFIGLRYLLSKREQEQNRKKYYDNYQNMKMKIIGDCIDITKETYNKILKKGYKVSEYYLKEKWNPLYN
jgi:uridine kinase